MPRPNEGHRSYHRLARFLNYIDSGLDQPIRIADAADHASVSIDTLGRLVFDVFQVDPEAIADEEAHRQGVPIVRGDADVHHRGLVALRIRRSQRLLAPIPGRDAHDARAIPIHAEDALGTARVGRPACRLRARTSDYAESRQHAAS